MAGTQWNLSNQGQLGGPYHDATILAWITSGQLQAGAIQRPGGAWWMHLCEHPPFEEALRARFGESAAPSRVGLMSTETMQAWADHCLAASAGAPASPLSLWPTANPKKVANATASFAPLGAGESGLALLDGTAFGSAKDGLVVSSAALYGKAAGVAQFRVGLADLTYAVAGPRTRLGLADLQVDGVKYPGLSHALASGLAELLRAIAPGASAEAPPEPTAEQAQRLEQIRREIAALGWADTFGTRAEIKRLPTLLFPDEHVLGVSSGLMSPSESEGVQTWLLVVTQYRVLLVNKKFLGGLTQKEIQLSKISAVEARTKLLYGEMKLHTSGTSISIEHAEKNSIIQFARVVNELLHQGSQPRATTPVPTSSSSMADELRKLKSLHDEGILTDQEFAQAKARLLQGS